MKSTLKGSTLTLEIELVPKVAKSGGSMILAESEGFSTPVTAVEGAQAIVRIFRPFTQSEKEKYSKEIAERQEISAGKAEAKLQAKIEALRAKRMK